MNSTHVPACSHECSCTGFCLKKQTNCFAGLPQQERDEWKELEAGLTLNLIMYHIALPFGWCQGLLELYKASSTRREAVPKNRRQRGTKELDCGAGGLIAQELIELKCQMTDYISSMRKSLGTKYNCSNRLLSCFQTPDRHLRN